MPLLHSADVQLLFLEMQPQIVASSRTVSPAELSSRAGFVSEACRGLAVPVTATTVRLGPDEPILVDELTDLTSLVRATVSPFKDPVLRSHLDSHGRKVLAVGGVSSEIAVLHTSLDAVRAGYRVHVLVDICGGLSERTEAAAFRQLELAGAVPSSVSSFFTGMVSDMSTGPGPSVMAVLARLWSWDAGDDSRL